MSNHLRKMKRNGTSPSKPSDIVKAAKVKSFKQDVAAMTDEALSKELEKRGVSLYDIKEGELNLREAGNRMDFIYKGELILQAVMRYSEAGETSIEFHVPKTKKVGKPEEQNKIENKVRRYTREFIKENWEEIKSDPLYPSPEIETAEEWIKEIMNGNVIVAGAKAVISG